MKRILITGATGNIGREVIHYLFEQNTPHQIIAGVRDIQRSKPKFDDYTDLEYVHFDFEDSATFDEALGGIDSIFLLRPPHIADINRYFKPLIQKIKAHNISETMFLSIQGVEKSKVIPHNKIEQLIIDSNLNYIFLRPSYFMQNLTTTLMDDISKKRKIILPAGKAKFNWIDIQNIGEVAAILLQDFKSIMNQAIELTGYENEDFYEVEKQINQVVTRKITYQSVNPLTFYRIKKKDGMPRGMIMVMIMLHFLPRFQKSPKISDFYEKLTSNRPTTLAEFIEREKEKLE